MCGLAGVLDYSGQPVDPDLLVRMIGQVRHRGPDGTGFFADGPMHLAHARLSIIDLEGGDQPIPNEDGSIWTVCNGEVFNYVELRAELEALGHRFSTRTDTETLVHAYEQWGDEFVHRLNGQYAFALWDVRRRRLLLVRDRPGIIPLYLHDDGRRLAFSSEIKGLLPAMRRGTRMNLRALDQIFTFWAPVSPDTVFDGVVELGPGELLVVEDGRCTRRQYWDWTFPAPDDHRTGRDDDLAAELFALLEDATRLRLRADVPVGAYLSGGLDSSAIAALIRGFGDVRLRTFSLTFEEAALDESIHQQRMVEWLQAEHSVVEAKKGHISLRFLETIRHTESPILRTAPVPMGILSGLVRDQGFKVVLTGEGADEVLGGYDLFKETKIRQFWARRPDSGFRAALLRRLYPYLDLGQGRGDTYLKHFFGQALEHPELPFFSHLPRWTTTARAKTFFSDDLKDRLATTPQEALMRNMPPAFPSWHPFHRAQYLEAKTLMAGYLLSSQGDRMLMSNAVEGRFPFLDHRVVEFANKLDPKHKMRGLREKALLKRAMASHLPAPIVERYKQPYRAPDIDSFFPDRGPPEWVEELLSREALRDAGYFDPERVGRLVKKIRAGRAVGAKDNMALVGILSTQAWHHLFVTPHRDPDGSGTFPLGDDRARHRRVAESIDR